MDGKPMRRSVSKFVFIISLCLLLTPMVPSHKADYDSMAVFIFIEDKPAYVDGEVVNITIHVLDKGEYLDNPDNISLTVNETKNIPFVKIDSGIYKATYTLNISEAESPSWAIITFEAFASYSKNSESVKKSVRIYANNQDATKLLVDLRVDDPRDFYPRLGDNIELTVTIRINGELANPDTLEIEYLSNSISHELESTGIYKAVYTINSHQKDYNYVTIYAFATYKDVDARSIINLKLNYFNIWFHNVSFINDLYKAYIWVSDLEGQSVAAAHVYINESWMGGNYQVDGGITDENGMLYVTFYHFTNPLWFFRAYDVCVISKNNVRQEFILYIDDISSSKGPNLVADKFQIFLESGNPYIPFSEKEKREYTAYYDRSLWRNSEIYYYVVFFNCFIYSNGGIVRKEDGFLVKHGCVNTDNNGEFEIEFTTPNIEGEINIYFEAGVERSSSKNENLSYHRAIDEYSNVREMVHKVTREEAIEINMDDLILGKNMTVSSSFNDSNGFKGKITWNLLDETWSQEEGRTFENMGESQGIFTGVFNLPDFLPLDKEYLINVSLTDPESGITYYNYILSKPIARASDMDADGLPDSWEQEYLGMMGYNSNQDPDKDGLSNYEELSHKTHPKKKDTDSDGMGDGWELTNNLDPLNKDAHRDNDYDGFNNLKEYKAGTDPNDKLSFPSNEGEYNFFSQFWWLIILIVIGCTLIVFYFVKRRKGKANNEVIEVTVEPPLYKMPPPHEEYIDE